MLFNTIEFAVFLPLVCLVFFLLAPKHRVMFLLLASYYFYMYWRWQYLLLLLTQTELNFLAALAIARAQTRVRKKCLLAFALLATLLILFFFKYFNFAAGTAGSLASMLGLRLSIPKLDFLLPVGISFHTFQTVGYTIDVYRRKIPPETSFTKFALFVSFFPLLVAGPIERASNLLPQFDAPTRIRYENLAVGLRLILWGLIKKMVIADRLSTAVANVYSDPHSFPGPLLMLATFFFAIQIYCDFSGYSDIAIGAARLLGFKLMTNFKMPYFSTSLSDFWRRWHISLSTWFRDYLYFPLGGNRVRLGHWMFNILVVFCLSGLWHGASWTFVVWGAIHGTWLISERLLGGPATRLLGLVHLTPQSEPVRVARWCLVFGIVMCSWVFFRASSVGEAVTILSGFLDWRMPTLPQTLNMGLPAFELGLCFLCIVVLACIDAALLWQPAVARRVWSRRPVRWAAYVGGFYSLVFFAVLGHIEFIYFQF